MTVLAVLAVIGLGAGRLAMPTQVVPCGSKEVLTTVEGFFAEKYGPADRIELESIGQVGRIDLEQRVVQRDCEAEVTRGDERRRVRYSVRIDESAHPKIHIKDTWAHRIRDSHS